MRVRWGSRELVTLLEPIRKMRFEFEIVVTGVWGISDRKSVDLWSRFVVDFKN